MNYGVEFGIYSKKTQRFIRYDPDQRRVKADSVHPFLKVNSKGQDGISLEEFRIYSEKDPSTRGMITFGSHIYIINKYGLVIKKRLLSIR